MKAGVATVPPGFFSGTRWTFAGLVLLAWWQLQGRPLRLPPRVLRRLIWVSVLLISLNAVVMLYGLRYVPVGLAAVINAGLTPVSMLGFGVAFGLERFRMRQLAAFALGIGGILLLFGPQGHPRPARLPRTPRRRRHHHRQPAFIPTAASPRSR